VHLDRGQGDGCRGPSMCWEPVVRPGRPCRSSYGYSSSSASTRVIFGAVQEDRAVVDGLQEIAPAHAGSTCPPRARSGRRPSMGGDVAESTPTQHRPCRGTSFHLTFDPDVAAPFHQAFRGHGRLAVRTAR
jgi:hypothetical protein